MKSSSVMLKVMIKRFWLRRACLCWKMWKWKCRGVPPKIMLQCYIASILTTPLIGNLKKKTVLPLRLPCTFCSIQFLIVSVWKFIVAGLKCPWLWLGIAQLCSEMIFIWWVQILNSISYIIWNKNNTKYHIFPLVDILLYVLFSASMVVSFY
jgi:hypothetical protein